MTTYKCYTISLYFSMLPCLWTKQNLLTFVGTLTSGLLIALYFIVLLFSKSDLTGGMSSHPLVHWRAHTSHKFNTRQELNSSLPVEWQAANCLSHIVASCILLAGSWSLMYKDMGVGALPFNKPNTCPGVINLVSAKPFIIREYFLDIAEILCHKMVMHHLDTTYLQVNYTIILA